MRALFAFAASLTLIATVVWPVPVKAQIIIGQGRAGVVIINNDITINGEGVRPEPDPAGPHLIEFFDGRLLHGTIDSVDLAHQELSWRRSDIDAPLVIPTTEISRLSFDPASQSVSGSLIEFGGLQPVPNPAGGATESKCHDTIQFTGGDWLVAEVTSILDNKIHLQLADGSPLVADRAQVEWIYLAKGPAAECYEGPTGLSGWNSRGGWTYRDGTLRTTIPTEIWRGLRTLPDQVEYQFEVDQGNLPCAFNFWLHGRMGMGWNGVQRMVSCSLSGDTFTVASSSGNNNRNQQVKLPAALAEALDGRLKPGKHNPVSLRIFEDFTGGRLLVFINGQKAGEWNLEKGEAGGNNGTFTFQPIVSGQEQVLSKIRVLPWDGRLPEDPAQGDAPAADRIVLADGTSREGKFVDLASGTVRMRVDNAAFESARDQVRMLRFSRPSGLVNPPASVAHLRLALGGELDAAGLRWQDGKFDVGTRFGTEIAVPVAAVSDLRFSQTAPALTVAEDVLVFKNGDRLKGHLESVSGNQKLRWRVGESNKAVDFAQTHVMGVRRDGVQAPDHKRIDCVARFRNGDWLAGQFLTLDKDSLVLNTEDAGQLTIGRSHIRTLYFSRDGALPISDGTNDEREWIHGLDLRNGMPGISGRPAPLNPVNLWKSFDGNFTLSSPAEAQVLMRTGGVHIGRQLDNLPALVELSFDVTGVRNQILFSAQLFSEPGNPGYLVQFHGQGLYIYDLNPAQRARGAVMPQQTQFDNRLKPDAAQRHIQVLANRDSGKVTLLVDGVVVTHFGAKAGAPPRQLGRGVMLSPQIGMPCSFSNLWVGPWNGRIPGATTGPDPAPDTAVLNNGDETNGIIEIATPAVVKMNSEVGPLELPVDRLTMLDFGGLPPARSPGARIHLAGSGALTIGAYRVENDTVACHSEIAGDLLLPLGAIQELVLSSISLPKQEDEKQ